MTTLFQLDVLPGHCALEAEYGGGGQQVRFRARDSSGPSTWSGREMVSAWSGWFAVADCPIDLTWSAFDFR